MRRIDIISAIVLLILSGYVIVTAMGFPLETRTLGPDFFPKLVGGCLAAFSLVILLRAFLRGGDEEAPSAPSRNLIIIMTLLGAYIFLLPMVGFLVATPAYLAATGLLLAGNLAVWWKKVCVSATVTTGALYYLFGTMLNVPLP
jgi:hypothetical protein